jgi:riboflavin transporter FmnP
MAILGTAVLAFSIAWLVWQLCQTRRKLLGGESVAIPTFAATLVFALCIATVVVTDVSALHLLWLFPMSAVVGGTMLFFPAGVKLTMACLGWLTALKPYREP